MNVLENEIIRHCAPTLAGLKTGNLFSYPYRGDSELRQQVSYWNDLLNKRGVMLKILKQNERRALIYVYRQKRLVKDLSCPRVQSFLKEIGYQTNDLQACLTYLSARVCNSASFPHEIGLFLSYPFEDVEGFIRHAGKNEKQCGCWKVYCNAEEKNELFNRYNKCTRIYCQRFRTGSSILRLTVG
ncbi:DUF3793 family protein [Acetobacterium woodii]|uniref:Putative cell surface protein n=1 Tax=Acetobacterium woodii (strain ATCC 29683 / DSM 1030 / JCM 2381 / KCTC 1655 / WB1) TaxID=931626 RepID=H6LKA5_ACEWD|nr:DUF3793 family protein [Acetobacterium woodii]AFA50025.1 putative cell surface protein [Acetobacterium woodii DSM 1030]